MKFKEFLNGKTDNFPSVEPTKLHDVNIEMNDGSTRDAEDCIDGMGMSKSASANSDDVDSTKVEFSDVNGFIPPLFTAIQLADVNGVKRELNFLTEDDINGQFYTKQMPIHVACTIKNLQILKLLIDHKAKFTVKDALGNTPLHIAVEENWMEGVKLLLLNGACPNVLSVPPTSVKGVATESSLCRAVRMGHLEIFKLIMQFDADLTVRDGKGRTVLHLAMKSFSKEIIDILLENDFILKRLNDYDVRGNTVLHELVRNENITKEQEGINYILRLVTLGMDVNVPNFSNETILYLSIKSKYCFITKELLKIGADPTIVTSENKNILHAACQFGCSMCLKTILDTTVMTNFISSEDNNGLTPFHYAVESLSIECCELLIRNGDHLTRVDNNGESRCKLLLDKVPSASALLTKLMDAHISVSNNKEFDADFHIEFDYSMIISKQSHNVQCSLISELNTTLLEDLLKHPLLESFLYIKWQYIKYFFYTNVSLYFIFLVLHTYYVTDTYGNVSKNWQDNMTFLLCLRIWHIVMFFIIFIPEIILLFGNFKKLFRSPETYLKFSILGTSAFILFSPNAANNTNTMNIETQVAAVSILLSWIEFMMLLGRFPYFGTSILMLTRVARNIVSFLFAFASLIIGFALAFSILFKHQRVFINFPNSILKTLMMMIGEIDYGDIVSEENYNSTLLATSSEAELILYSIVTKVILTVFLFLVPILLANLLIGLAVNDIPDLQRQGKIKRLSKQASYLVSYEKLLQFAKDFRLFPRFLRIIFDRKTRISDKVPIYPNRKHKKIKSLIILPNETLDAAILLKKQHEEDYTDDIEPNEIGIDKQFYRFRRMYRYDRRQIDGHFKALYNKIDDKKFAQFQNQLNEIQNALERQNALFLKLLTPQNSTRNLSETAS